MKNYLYLIIDVDNKKYRGIIKCEKVELKHKLMEIMKEQHIVAMQCDTYELRSGKYRYA